VRPLLLLALPLAVVLTACSWLQSPLSSSPPHTALGRPACSLELYFVTQATHAQEKLVGAKLRRDPRVEKIVFVSKAQALKEFKKHIGNIPKNFMQPNPLPDAFKIAPAQRSEAGPLKTWIAHSHWPGVETTRLKPCKK
jgi:cell division protein FtsX